MEKRGLTEVLTEETVARLTEEAFQTPGQSEGKRTVPRLLALAASLVLVVTALNFSTVYAAVRELLYFLPGSGTVGTETLLQEYWLPTQDYAASTPEGDYFVSFLYRLGDTLSLRVEKRVTGLPVEADREDAAAPLSETENGPAAPGSHLPPALSLSVSFRDENGRELELDDYERSVFSVHDTTNGTGSVAEELEIPGFTLDTFTLVLDGRAEFPVALSKADPEDYALSGSAIASDAGYSISLLPLNKSCTRFALIPTPEGERAESVPEGSYWSPLSLDTEAVGESGRVYQAEPVNNRPGCQEFYLPDLPEERIAGITVAAILESTRYDRSPAAVCLPALALGEERELAQRIDLGNIVLRTEAAGLTEDGELWVRLTWEEEAGRHLNQVDLDWPKGSEQSWAGHGIQEETEHILSHNGLTAQAGKRTTLPITFVSLVQKGQWKFTLS